MAYQLWMFQEILQVAVGGMPLTQTVEGRERYAVRVRYPRELRANPDDLRTSMFLLKKEVLYRWANWLKFDTSKDTGH